MKVILQKCGEVEFQMMDSITDIFHLTEFERSFTRPEGQRYEDYLAKGIGEEAGEVLGVLKKMDRGDPRATRDWLVEEMGDLLYYVLKMCREHDIHPMMIGGVLRAKLKAFELLEKP